MPIEQGATLSEVGRAALVDVGWKIVLFFVAVWVTPARWEWLASSLAVLVWIGGIDFLFDLRGHLTEQRHWELVERLDGLERDVSDLQSLQAP